VGPYLVVRAIPPVNFVIQKSERTKPIVVHIDKLKKCCGQTPVSWLTVTEPVASEDSVTEVVPSDGHVETDRIVEKPLERRRRNRFLNERSRESRLPTIEEAPEGDAVEQEVTRPKRDNRRVPQRFKDYACTRVTLDDEGGDGASDAACDRTMDDPDSVQLRIESLGVVRRASGRF